jgi:general L-amino acid transport system substrate-binding protein
MMNILTRTLLAATLFMCGITAAYAQTNKSTLDIIRARGVLLCGVHTGLPGFAAPDDKGNWVGFDIDYCRAVATAIFNDPAKVQFKPLTSKDRITTLQTGEVDIVSRTSTWTMGRDTAMGVSFIGIMFHDGQAFMAKRSLGVKSAKDLNGASICVQTGTTTELNLADYFRTNMMTYKSIVFEKTEEALAGFEAGRCDAYTNDSSGLASGLSKMKNQAEAVILPEIISKEPLSPIVRQGDSQFFTLVKWVYFALLNLEEAGVTSANADDMRKTSNPDVKRLIGTDGDFGQGLGVNNDWAYQIVKKVGNYGEIYDRHFGPTTNIKIERGPNKLWNQGGLQYAPPIR